MSAQSFTTAPSPSGMEVPARTNATVISRPTLQTRPMIQRMLIRSWEYNSRAVRVAVLIVRLLVTLWLLFLGAALLSIDIAWGWTLLPSAEIGRAHV